jgi:hypothetical protein
LASSFFSPWGLQCERLGTGTQCALIGKIAVLTVLCHPMAVADRGDFNILIDINLMFLGEIYCWGH